MIRRTAIKAIRFAKTTTKERPLTPVTAEICSDGRSACRTVPAAFHRGRRTPLVHSKTVQAAAASNAARK